MYFIKYRQIADFARDTRDHWEILQGNLECWKLENTGNYGANRARKCSKETLETSEY